MAETAKDILKQHGKDQLRFWAIVVVIMVAVWTVAKAPDHDAAPTAARHTSARR